MTEEQWERQTEFIVATLARVAVGQEQLEVNMRQLQINMKQLEVNMEKGELRLSRLERIAKLMVRAGLRERKGRREGNEHLKQVMTEGDERLKQAMAELATAQKRTEESIAHTDKRLDALIDIVGRQQNGRSSH